MKRSILLLDEPTNHLDFETVEALGAALRLFPGTVFFISHDRTFVNMIATEIVQVAQGSVKRYGGRYADYVYHLEHELRQELTESSNGKPAATKEPSEYHRRKQQESTTRKLAGRIKRSEAQQETYRAEKEKLEAEIAANPLVWTPTLTQRLDALTRLLREEERVWLELQEQLSSLSSS